jgi:2-polyprenyl-6-methoxyphenol hydroxylase-like FAD-dependent oxidoreductase
MTRRLETSVLIVGGGPVGLTLAIDLASRGVDVVVAEKRPRREPPSVKCNHVSARSMEIFRRLGVADALRHAGLPSDYPNDCSFRTTFTGPELARIPIPCRRDRFTATGGPDTWWPTPEPPHRINQIYLEPILFDHAEAHPRVTILNRVEVGDFVQDDHGVVAEARDLDSGAALSIACAYMVGCDGGRSGVRRGIGATLIGDPVIQRVQSTHIRAPGLIDMGEVPPAWGMVALNPRRSGTVYAIDGVETWLVHNYLREGEEDFDAVDRDWAIRAILGVGEDFAYAVISKEDWIGRRLVADRFRDGRVFLCGDAAHIWVPYAGYGMNAGIADAANLAWLMAAHLAGWAPAAILDAHERERLPITEQVSRFAMDHAHSMIRRRRAIPEGIEEPGPDGDALRAEIGREMYHLNVQQYCCAGLNFGYFYDRSPLIAYDGEAAPAYSMGTFTASTVPGCRTPHAWLADGRSLYDVMGADFALVCSGGAAGSEPLAVLAARRGIPLKIVDDSDIGYDRRFVLSRPDQHVAWRGDGPPEDPADLLDRITGRGI